MPNLSPKVCDSNETCNCKQPCSGYGSRINCPPLIVIAVLAVSHAAVLAGVCAARGGR